MTRWIKVRDLTNMTPDGDCSQVAVYATMTKRVRSWSKAINHDIILEVGTRPHKNTHFQKMRVGPDYTLSMPE